MIKRLVICEKPAAAVKIASAISGGGHVEKKMNGVPYYEIYRGEEKIVVVPALGHLFTLKNTRPMRDYPVYDVDWVPVYEADRRASRARIFVEAIRELAKNATDYISACDFDIEGSVIAFMILKYLCGEDAVKRAKRMKFSTLTVEELRRSYENPMPRLDFEQIEAGIARHVMDWYWGINTSLALSSAVKAAEQRFAKLSAGRVQTPTLKILADREREIRTFRPEPYWAIRLLLDVCGDEIAAAHATPRFFDKDQAQRVLEVCRGKPAKVSSINLRQYRRLPPVPFDLGTLQAEAYRCFGYTPMRTQQLAQDLYLAGLISYPRTSSQKLPVIIGYERIVKKLGEIEAYQKLANDLLAMPKLIPNEGKKSDPAHPSIHPTGENPGGISGQHRKLYDLIVRRFLSVFGEPATLEGMKVELEVGGEPFLIHGRRIIDEGWLKYYGQYGASEEIILPKIREGDTLPVKDIVLEEKETQPPPRYNPASIVKKMEEIGIGTKSTRATIVQHLYEREYIHGSQITVTDLGLAVVDAILKHCPEIASEELTAEFEREMDAIQEGRKTKEEVIARARAELDKILSKFREHEMDIGKELAEAHRLTRMKQGLLGKCQRCGGDLRIIVSRTSRKRFAGCSNYPRCSQTFPLPQSGTIVPLNKKCEKCGSPIVQVNRPGRRPYRMCLNPQCESKDGWNRNAGGSDLHQKHRGEP
ncbi:MAG: DNA topoisomerase I [Candidatus Hadarchaeales archaeon]